ncbi:GNAT family N-acetyltransferase [Anaerocolumna sp. MB42-C2]|uniref:GNAT family N-acetyltransferase n=1 Tax=Anaerocolumna sp. MB42-C2 TaxID=3070997 RepID=UPI0027E21170|nr:GNAT family N-acetyltransferase [Anaerocolumna sp. MB42-C2]WMJ87074.1 GNAT family N-acetyltransferase [Anaerocolumna sp. MB42-C2]
MNHKIYQIREMRSDERYILDDMLYEAIYQSDENNLLPREIIQRPEIKVYIEDFGKEDDYCLVAEVTGKIVGAVWVRILSGPIKGYGYLDSETPEFSISLLKEYRNQGIGTALMNKMIQYLSEKGYKKASLSVSKNNYAFKLYQKLGFKIINEQEEDYIMVLELYQ